MLSAKHTFFFRTCEIKFERDSCDLNVGLNDGRPVPVLVDAGGIRCRETGMLASRSTSRHCGSLANKSGVPTLKGDGTRLTDRVRYALSQWPRKAGEKTIHDCFVDPVSESIFDYREAVF